MYRIYARETDLTLGYRAFNPASILEIAALLVEFLDSHPNTTISWERRG